MDRLTWRCDSLTWAADNWTGLTPDEWRRYVGK